jgi:hypothetical protein
MLQSSTVGRRATMSASLHSRASLGVKWQLNQESESVPMIGIFPLLEITTGNADKGLGNGRPDIPARLVAEEMGQVPDVWRRLLDQQRPRQPELLVRRLAGAIRVLGARDARRRNLPHDSDSRRRGLRAPASTWAAITTLTSTTMCSSPPARVCRTLARPTAFQPTVAINAPSEDAGGRERTQVHEGLSTASLS